MQQKLMVLLVEDDIQACEAIVDCCLSSNDITLTNVTNNSVKAIEMIQSYLPDAIILDLELHHGSGNGFQVLQGLKGLHLDHKPYILVTTNNTSAIMKTLDELRDSRILYEKKVPPFGYIIVLIVLALLIGVVVWSLSAPKVYVIKANGTVTNADANYVMPAYTGVIAEANMATQQELTSFPSKRTEQAPHSPSLQPHFTEVQQKVSRRASSRRSVAEPSYWTALSFRLNWMVSITHPPLSKP